MKIGLKFVKLLKSALLENNVSLPVFGMVKDDHHSTRALINEEREEFEISEALFNFITNFQDEVHNTAIEYHRKIRDKEMTKSKLDYIEGIGEKKRTALLKKFGSVAKIKDATIEEISEIKGINVELAKKIKEELEK